ncbi:hypothetical protein LQZ19_05170 [Treponema primitia]|uniref:hypothetical protein n=1 Tax=Treponema primitia TaxID=88058 RepID=UPI00397F843E
MKKPEVSIKDLWDLKEAVRQAIRKELRVCRHGPAQCEVIPFPVEKSGHDTAQGERCIILSIWRHIWRENHEA